MTQWELAESSSEVSRGLDDIVENSPGTHQKFARKFVGRQVTRKFVGRQVTRKLVESSPEECWKFIGSSPKEIGSSLRVHRKDVGSLLKRQSDNEDCVYIAAPSSSYYNRTLAATDATYSHEVASQPQPMLLLSSSSSAIVAAFQLRSLGCHLSINISHLKNHSLDDIVVSPKDRSRRYYCHFLPPPLLLPLAAILHLKTSPLQP
ncbi:hypothetical protein B296_00011411 [Ensete ventricosum]|uniref:Uncharacterized protein n=1 Tax=Ensete ventricosum TaxID=4639 RepID=A0A426YTF0_ENSVE|nr:hypothetical protein B296_00011411 [Ensete ventricosum]